jgi:hypothetical protein
MPLSCDPFRGELSTPFPDLLKRPRLVLMAKYPQPPPGTGWGAQANAYSAEQALAAWGVERNYELNAQPATAFYMSWYPFQYLPRITHVSRDLHTSFGGASVFVAEAYDNDPLRQAVGTHRMLLCLLMSPNLGHRVAVRSKTGGGIGADIERGLNELGNLLTSKPPAGPVLGDPILERALDVRAPTPEEGNLALPQPLRRLLVQDFRGILETRPQGMAATFFDYTIFEPRSLDAVLHLFRQLYQRVLAPGVAQ